MLKKFVLIKNTLLNIAFYDGNKGFISGANTPANPISVPVGAAYLRISSTHLNMLNMQIEVGESVTTYEPFKILVDKLYVDKYVDKSVSYRNTNFVTIGKNKFNKLTITPNKLVNQENGELAEHTSYFASDYIIVDEIEKNLHFTNQK